MSASIRFLAFAFFQLLCFATLAQENTKTKACYEAAKEEINNMLIGKEAISYERAIFLVENAWHDNKNSYRNFQAYIDFGTNNIHTILKQMPDYPAKKEPENFFDDLQRKSREDQGYQSSARANYAIYKYMTDTTYFVDPVASNINCHYKYQYAIADPFGSKDWTNTQVGNLLLNGQGNCYALASLFKIYSERLASGANICTAPSHVYIRHKDENGTSFNVEIGGKSFPGTGTLSTLTYTTQDGIRNGISLRELDLKQSVALCLVYLAKGYEHKLNLTVDDGFMMGCADLALQCDSLNLNAMLLKAEIQENKLLYEGKAITLLQKDADFKNYQQLIGKLYNLGYREMPLQMKNLLIKGWTKDTVSKLAYKNYLLPHLKNGASPTRYASLSWGLFDEDIKDKPVERFGKTLYDTKLHRIKGFAKEQMLYNSYNFDPVVFAWNVDPAAKEFPSWSPYAALGDNPIRNVDPDGRKFYNFNSSGDYVGTSHDNWFHNLFFKQGRLLDGDGNVTRQFRFADRQNDTKDIENGTITKVIVVSDADLKKLVARSGGFDAENKTANRDASDRYGYIEKEGKGRGKMDFSITQIPQMFPEASSSPMSNPSSVLFLPPSPNGTSEYAHNHMNFGNYLFGLSGQAQGFSLAELQYGGEYNSLFNSPTNGYGGQFDSRDDQFSIGKGFEYGKSYGYDKKEFKVEPGQTTPEAGPSTGK